MKKHITDLAVGLVLGLIVFLGGSYFFDIDPLSPPYYYYISMVALAVIYALTPHIKSRKFTVGSSGKRNTTLVAVTLFVIGLLLPFVFWAYVTISAVSNWTLF